MLFLVAPEGLGGWASIHELDNCVATDLVLPDGMLDIVHGNGPQTEFSYR